MRVVAIRAGPLDAEVDEMVSMMSGTLAGTGSFRCVDCDFVVSLAAADELPPCPGCGGEEFVRASLFTTEPDTTELPGGIDSGEQHPWLEEVRDELDQPGQYLAYDDGETIVVAALTREWTRIGRSLAADIRFDDPTVSRRHALIVHQADGVRVLDDRSLNGVFVNGERIEWRALQDGDTLVVGRHHLSFIDFPAIAGERQALPHAEALA
jgi:FHA domain/Zinc-ribbon containing domain